MDRRIFFYTAGAGALAWKQLAQGQQKDVADLGGELEAIRQKNGLPGIAAAAVRDGQIIAEGTAGVRRLGEDKKITPNDRFAVASCTKRMTAAMIGRVIDAGKLSFDTTLAEALSDIPMRDEYRAVTIAQLLTFTGGIPPYTEITPAQTPIMFTLKGPAAEQREAFIKHVLQEEPVVKPGTERRYSNASYALAGYVAERRTGKSWEDLMREQIFQPLSMTTAGFGRPRTKERPNEPTRYRKEGDAYVPETDERAGAVAVMAPAGDVHCSIRDFARFAAYELNAARGHNAMLSASTAERWRELSQARGPAGAAPGAKKAGGKLRPKGAKGKAPPEGKAPLMGKAPPGGGDSPAYFGGSPFISAGFILWPGDNLAAAVAISAGTAQDAVRAAFDAIKQQLQPQAGK